MSDVAIRVDNLGKEYRIGSQQASYRTIRETLIDAFQAPFQRAGKLFRGQASGAANLDETIWALRDVSFEIKQGDVVGVIGRNGAGKSTLLKILSRITEPTTGRVELHGRVGSLLEVGTGFHPELTGRENIYLNGAILGMTRNDIERQFDEIVDFAEVEKFIDTPVKHYSSGMYLRLAFAVAAHLEPEILLVDEVLAVGDAAFQKKCLGKMGEVANEGRTVLLVSHNMTAVQSLCGRCLLIDAGHIQMDGSPSGVVASYQELSINASDGGPTGIFELTNRRNQHLADTLMVNRLTLCDAAGVPRAAFRMGQAAFIVVDLSGFSAYDSSQIGIIIKSSSGQVLSSINSGMQCSSVERPRQRDEQAVLHIHSIPMMPGTYFIDVAVSQQGSRRLDYVEDAASFEVLEADVYGTGYQLSSYFGLFYLEADWRIRRMQSLQWDGTP